MGYKAEFINGKWVASKEYVKPRVDFTGDRGFTVQADRDDADISKIIARFEKSGTLARVNSREPFYGDVSDIGGLADAMIKVQKANELFMTYDARIRERFDNDPRKFVEFFEDENNLKEAIELGLAQPRPEPVPAQPAQPAPVNPPA